MAEAFESVVAKLRDAPTDLSLLRELRENAQDPDERASCYEYYLQAAAAAPEAKRGMAFLLMAAEIAREDLKDPYREFQTLKQVLAQDAGNVEIMKSISEALRRARAWERLVDHNLACATASQLGARERLEFCIEAADVLERELSDRLRAFQQLTVAAELAELEPATVQRMVRLGQEANEPDRLREALRVALERSTEDRSRVAILLALGRLHGEGQDGVLDPEDIEEARRAFGEVLVLQPNHAEALAALDELDAKAREIGAHAPETAAPEAEAPATSGSFDAFGTPGEWGEEGDDDLDLAQAALALESDWPGPGAGADDGTPAEDADAGPADEELREALLEAFGEEDAIVADAFDGAAALEAPTAVADLTEVGGDEVYSDDVAADLAVDSQLMAAEELGQAPPESLSQEIAELQILESDAVTAGGQAQAIVDFDEPELPPEDLIAWITERLDGQLSSAPPEDDAATAAMEQARRHWLTRRGALRLDEERDLVGAFEDLSEASVQGSGEVGVFANLVEAAEKLELWDEAAAARRRLANLQRDPQARVANLVALGRLLEARLGEAQAAAAVYEEVLKVDPGHGEAFEYLENLLEAMERWAPLAELLQWRGEHLKGVDAGQAARELARSGDILRRRLQRHGAAITRYLSALDIDSNCAAALDALGESEIPEDQRESLLTRLSQALEEITDSAARAAALSCMGSIFRSLGEQVQAVDCYRQALGYLPGHLPALDALATHLVENDEFEEAIPLLARAAIRLKAQGDKGDRERLANVCFLMGRCAEAVENADDAVHYYGEALEARPAHRQSLDRLSTLRLAAQDYQGALDCLRSLLLHHRDGMEDSEAAQTFMRLGETQAALSQGAAAIGSYEEVLKIEPDNRPALERLARLYASEGEHRLALGALKRLFEQSPDEDSKLEIARRAGELCSLELEQPAEAVDWYRKAIALAPKDEELHRSLVRELLRAGRWSDAIEAHEELLRVLPEDDLDARTSVERATAALYRDKLGDFQRAEYHLRRALSLDPLDRESREGVARLLEKAENWRGLDDLYGWCIDRLADPRFAENARARDEELALLETRAEVRIERLDDRNGALECLEQLGQRDGVRPDALRALAGLYREAGRLAEAAATQRRILALTPFDLDAYRELRRMYQRQRAWDPVYCLCSTMRFLGEANAEESKFHKAGAARASVAPRAALGSGGEDLELLAPLGEAGAAAAEIYALLRRARSAVMPEELESLGVKADARLIGAAVPPTVRDVLEGASAALGVALPMVFRDARSEGGVRVLPTPSPSLAISQKLLEGATRDPEDAGVLAFLTARAVTLTLPQHILAATESPASLHRLLELTAALIDPDSDAPTAELEQELGRLRPAVSETDRGRLEALHDKLGGRNGALDVVGLQSAVQLRGLRAGLLFAGDIESAARSARRYSSDLGPLPLHDAVRELVLFGVGDAFFELRRKLGLGLN